MFSDPISPQLRRSRFVASQLYATSGQLDRAVHQSALAWMTGAADPAVGVYLVRLYLATGDPASAALILRDVQKDIAPWDQRDHEQVAELKIKLAEASSR